MSDTPLLYTLQGVTPAGLAKLAEPTPRDEIKSRPAPGRGNKTLDYVDARFVMDRFDEACGPANWRDEYSEAKQSDGIVARIGVLVDRGDGDSEWVWKEDVGTESNIEATKGSYSDAFKRCAVKWGTGRDLYAGGATSEASHRPAQRTGSTTQRRAANNTPKNFAVSPDEAPWVCPEHEGVVAWPAGETGEGRKYEAFYACPEGRKCTHRAPRGLKVKPEHLGAGKSSDMDDLPF